jgi:hypothetical protein
METGPSQFSVVQTAAKEAPMRHANNKEEAIIVFILPRWWVRKRLGRTSGRVEKW